MQKVRLERLESKHFIRAESNKKAFTLPYNYHTRCVYNLQRTKEGCLIFVSIYIR